MKVTMGTGVGRKTIVVQGVPCTPVQDFPGVVSVLETHWDAAEKVFSPSREIPCYSRIHRFYCPDPACYQVTRYIPGSPKCDGEQTVEYQEKGNKDENSD